MKTTFFSLLFSVLFIAFANGQQYDNCYQTIEQEQAVRQRLQTLKTNISHSNQARTNEIQYVPVRFHLVANSDGEGRIDEAIIFEQLCVLNEYFRAIEGTDILQFYLKTDENGTAFDYRNHTGLYDDALDNFSVFESLKDPDAINVWVVNGDPTYIPNTGLFIIDKDFMLMPKYTLTSEFPALNHQFGHFFNLLHTYHGATGSSFTSNNDTIMAPDSTALGYWLEFVDGSNCETAGDLICDTPADYRVYLLGDDCTLQQVVLDPNGDELEPDLQQVMGLALQTPECPLQTLHFSFQQMEVMVASYNSPERDYLHTNETPASNFVVNNITLRLPLNGASTSASDLILEWEAVENATQYVVQISSTPSFFSIDYQTTSLTTSIDMSNILEEDRRYYWRVIPFNQWGNCNLEQSGISSSSFTTDLISTTAVLPTDTPWVLYPNPSSNEFYIDLPDELKNKPLTIEISTLNGVLLQQITVSNPSDILNVDTHQIPQGLYLLTIRTLNGGVLGSQKVVIQP